MSCQLAFCSEMVFSEAHAGYESALRESRRRYGSIHPACGDIGSPRAYVRVLASTFSPDGKYLVAGTSEGRICIWLLAAVKDHTEYPLRTVFSPGTDIRSQAPQANRRFPSTHRGSVQRMLHRGRGDPCEVPLDPTRCQR